MENSPINIITELFISQDSTQKRAFGSLVDVYIALQKRTPNANLLP